MKFNKSSVIDEIFLVLVRNPPPRVYILQLFRGK